MVPQAALNAWAQQAPWPTELDIEQDLILSRAMIDIASHDLLGDELAFRGGTTHGPVGDIVDAVRETLHVIGLEEADRSSATSST